MKLPLLLLTCVLAAPAQESRPPERVRVSGGVMAGSLIKKVTPVIPQIVQEEHVAGVGVMHVVIGKDGHVLSVDYISGPEALRQSYMDAVRQWVYRPYLLNGEPVEVDTVVTMSMQFGGLSSLAPQRVHLEPAELKAFVLHKVPPVDPSEAKQAHIEGSVEMHAIIGRDGHLVSVTAISGPPELRQSAIDAAEQWTYKPYVVDGQVREVDTTITITS